MTPQEKLIEQQGAEIGRLRSRIEILQYRLDNLMGRDMVDRLGLTHTEYRLAHLLANASPRVVTKTALLEARRCETDRGADSVGIKIVDVLIHKIRKKLGPQGMVIDTAWGSGYCMSEQSADKFYNLTYADTPNRVEEAA